jgi:hypothetical protein
MLTSAKGIAILMKAKIVTKRNITKVFKWRTYSILYVGGQNVFCNIQASMSYGPQSFKIVAAYCSMPFMLPW